MNADIRRLQTSFIQWDIPKTKQCDPDERIVKGEVGRISNDRTVLTALANAAVDLAYGGPCPYISDEYVEGRLPGLGESHRTAVNRKTLIKLLEPMTSEKVYITLKANAPVIVYGEIGEDPASAVIAPIIDEEVNE